MKRKTTKYLTKYIYVDRDKKVITEEEYLGLFELGDAYSLLKRRVFRRDALVSSRVSIVWEGKHNSEIPFEYICPFIVVIENEVQEERGSSTRFVIEPMPSALSEFGEYNKAKNRFESICKEFEKSGMKRCEDEEDNIEDYEPMVVVVSKDIPKSKSKIVGSW